MLRRIDWKRQHAIAQEVLDRLQVDVDPLTPVGALNATQRAEVGIARALRDQRPGEGVIILDEATRALPREELVQASTACSSAWSPRAPACSWSRHNLDEVLALADRVTILRDGKVVGAALETAGLTEQDMAKLMLGKTVGSLSRRRSDLVRPARRSPPVTGLVDRTGLAPALLEIRSGEIVGITGLPGTGLRDRALPRVRRPPGAGGLAAHRGGPASTSPTGDVVDCLRAGVALVPERRDRDGLAFEMSIRDNIALPNIRKRG